MSRFIIISFAAFFFFGCKNKPKKDVDFVIHHAQIYTSDASFHVVEAMAIDQGKIIATGTNEEILDKYQGKKEENLSGKVVYPGFIDAHCHFLGLGLMLNKVDLTGTYSFEDLIQKVQKYASTYQGDWIVGRGWNETLWEEKAKPNKLKLDLLFPDVPVCLSRVDGHAVLVNQVALDLAGIDERTIIPGGSIEKMGGMLTGILVDAAAEKVKSIIPKPNFELLKQAFLTAQSKCLSAGLTGVSDAGLDREEVEALLALDKEGKLKIRVQAMLNPTKENFNFIDSFGKISTPHLEINAVKILADGALGSRGALLKKPYCDDSLMIGLQQNTWQWCRETCAKLYNKGWQVNTHCIGDSANATMLKIYAEVLKSKNDRRWRIEHAQIVDPSDRHYFGDYSILPSVQPTHATSDMNMAENRLCKSRMPGAYAYKSLLKENNMLPLGTDFPVESYEPLGTYFSAVKRQNKQGQPFGGFLPNEAISFEEAIKGMTCWAAYASFSDYKSGSIEKGKWADFLVFNQDLKLLNRAEDAELIEVWIAGELFN